MKKLLLTTIALCFMICAWAYDFESDGIYYNIIDAENFKVEVTNSGTPYTYYFSPLEIPETVTGSDYITTYTVTAIGDYAFCESMFNSVTIPGSVTTIGKYAFSDCSNLNSVTIVTPEFDPYEPEPDLNSVTIGTAAFNNCSLLSSIELPNSLTSIQDSVFVGCSRLSSITIPASVKSIGSEAFSGCFNISSISFEDFSSLDSIKFSAFFYCGSSSASITIPESVTFIDNYAFNRSGFAAIDIQASITIINSNVFSDCESLTSITIPSSVTSFDDYAISKCPKLNSISISENVEFIASSAFMGTGGTFEVDVNNLNYSSSENVLFNKDKTVLIHCSASKTNYAVPASVITIGEYAFSNCEVLSSVTIPNTVTTIDKNAFQYCITLTTINIPTSVSSISQYTFYNSGLTNITLPSGIDSINNNAFNSCKSLSSVTIPESVTYIGSSTFSYCSALTGITIPNKITTIPNNLFYNCSELTTINLPDIVNSIESYAFSKCSKLTTIAIPDSVKSIESSVFENCSSLTEITIPDAVESIKKYAFSGCSKLDSVNIPEAIVSIGMRAFKNCAGLNAISVNNKIPDNVTLGSSVFQNVNKNTCTLYVPSGTKEAYQAANQWKDFTNIVAPIIPQSLNVILVDSAVTAGGDGSSWAKAYNSLQDALDAAEKGDTIWIAKGTYYPSSGYDLCDVSGDSTRYYHFELKDSVAIYGGFAGTETSPGQRIDFRDGGANETILSGDFKGDDYIDTTAYYKIKNNDENCYHVFYHSPALALDSTALLNGVTITGGNANGTGAHANGGGMYNESCSPTLNNITFRRNNAFTHGGGVYNDSSSPTLNNVTFRNNTAFNSGGAMSDIDASPSLTNILFCNNHADAGGGIYNFNSSAILTNVTICGNKANGSGKGGGGILNDGSSETLKLKNCIVYGNTANTNNGNDFYLRQGGKITLEYCCYGNGSNDIGGDGDFTTDDFTPDDNCITSDPKFVFVEDGDCRVYGNSLCVDAGNNAYTQAINDIRGSGFPRKLDQYNHTTEGTIDMGAYEYQEGTDLMEPGAVIYVKTTEDGGNDSYDGETWASAYASLQKALEKAQSGKQIWIAKGTYKPSSAYSLTVDGNRDFHFEMKEGVEIYGGFAGTEDPATFDPAGRDFITNKTILSGDIGIEGNNSDNCYHVFFHPNGTGLTSATVLDGVTITEGNANTNGIAPHMYGGGMYNDHCSPTLRNVVVSGNSADKGGGMYNSNSASPTLINVLICDNSSDYGGGIYNSGSESSPTLINLTISGNSAATYGGGMYNNQSVTTLNNCIIWGNESGSSGTEIYNNDGSVSLNYSCYGSVYGTVTPDANCTATNPMLADITNGDYRLYRNSPCVDAGNNNYNSEMTDIRGTDFGRKLLKTNPEQEGTIDMGVYEYKNGTDPLILYVKTDGSDSSDGYTWSTAYTTLQKALETAKPGNQIWIAAGTYKPGTTRESYFSMKEGVKIYGGFAGTETSLGERTGYSMGGTNETILSGDIGTPGNNSDNCYHVIYNPATPGLTVSSILDGFTITGGNADGDSPHNYGGGIYNDSSSPFLRNITIRGNSASKNGGGITNNSSSPVLTNIIISKNNATEHGGGIYNDSSSPVLTNITINGNDAANGGGIANSNSLSSLNNCIIWGNTATDNGDEIYISSSDVTTLNYSCYNNESGDVYDNGCTFTVTNNNITDNPEFVDVANGDYRIYGSSHCVDNGYNDYNTQTTDIRGSKFGRKLLKTDHTLEGSIDMGAYEYKESFDPKRPSRTMYVDDSATGGNNDGSNWANAYTSLQDALTEATSGDKIYIAAGTYKPGTTRDSYFSMKNGVAIYGGFEGTEDLTTFDLADRDFTINETILSGDIGLEGDSANDCYHVFCHPSTITLDSTAILNGVTITGGNADSDTYPDNSGGGMFNYYSSPTLTNVKIINNTAYQGGGMFNRETASSPKLTNVIISNNTAVTSGGGIYTSGFPVLTNVAITENVANQGGGMYNYCSSPTLINVTISGNKTTAEGGGIYHRGDASIYLLTLKNSIVWDNTSGTNSGNEFYFFNSDIELHYSCYGNSEGDIQKGDNSTFTPDANCTTSDPNFADTTIDDYRLYGNSLCKDAGYNDYNTETTDIRGQARIQNNAIDMGAYEWTEGIDPEPTIRYVNDDVAGGNNDGTSWDNAYASLQNALTAAHNGDQIWIAAGTYYPTKQVEGTGDRFATFQMKNGVEIYGSFAGTEDPATFDLANRNFTTNKTILSGNIGTKNTNIDNCYHVFFHPEGLALDSTALLDGVTITGGYADGPWEPWHDCGGGMFNYGSSPTLDNIVISDNTTVFYGGGICNVSSSSPTLTNVVIKGNTSAGNAGGLLCSMLSSPVLNNVTISGNTATNEGGGVYSNTSEPLTMNNCIVWGNTASSGGNEIYLNNTSVTMNYCCYGNDDGDIENTNSTFTPNTNSTFTPDANCTTSDPFFVNLSIGDFRIYGNSPCVNTGNNSYNPKSTDTRGKTRIQNTTIDMGAYEWTHGVDPDAFLSLFVQDTTLYLDSLGNASTIPSDLIVNAIGGNDTTLSISTFDCDNIDENKIAVSLLFKNAVVDTAIVDTAVVTVVDIIAPELEVKNITVQLDSSGNASITAKDLVTSTSDNCSVADTTISIVTGEKSAAISVPTPVSDTLFFSCSDTGENKVEIKLTDNSGNTTINTVTVTVEDTIKPVLDVKNITVQLDSSGNASVTAGDLVTGTSDNCSVADTTISIVTGEKSAAISVPAPVSDTLFFSCSDTGENKVEIKLTDNSGNTTINTVTVTVEDTIKPVLEVKNITVQLDSSGNASVTAKDLITNTSDNCSVADTTISIVTGEKSAAISVPAPVSDTLFFSCSDTGENKVEIKLTDNSGNTTINTVTVTVEDNIKPVLEVKNITVQLDSSGNASITAKDLVTRTMDNCSVADTTISIVTGEKSAAISVPTPVSDTLFFSCSDTGENKVEIKLTDNSGNTTINTVTVTVEDTIKPVLDVKNITVQLDSSGNASVTAGDLVTGTSDNCSVADTTISIVAGEKSAAISVPAPVSDTLFFSCSDTGENKVEIKLTDNSGNTTINTVTVTVEDTIKPVLEVKNITVQLDSSGNASVTAKDLITNTSDNCSVADTTISIVTGEKSAAISVPAPVSDTLFFSCSDTGENKVEIKLTDNSGNTTINTVTVTVEDNIKPVLEVKNITVQLDSSGNASITAKDLVTRTMDNCSVADTTISIVTGEKSAAISVPTPVSDTLFFSCSDTGENKVEIKLTDNSGNTTINTVTVTVEDTIKPVLDVKNITVQLDSSGNASVTAGDLVTGTSDNCSVADTTISIVAGEKSAAISVPAPVSDTLFFSCSDTGENKVEIKLTDNSGNTTINTVTVTVEDTIKPVLEVKNITVQLDSSGNASVTAKDLITNTSDNCSVADTTISIVTGEKSAAISVPAPVSDTLFFSCSDTGENKVEIKLTDNSGNTTINTVTVTVEDNIKPVLEVKNITVQLDSSGNASITAKDLVTRTMDNCSVADTTISIVTGEKSAAISVPTPVSDTLFFSCSDTGENKVEIKLTDNSGNTTINTVTVTVEDTIKPVLDVKNITVQLDSSGNASVTAGDLVTGTSDNCSVADTTISIVAGEKSAAISVPAPVSDTLFFSCSDTGENKVEIKLTDNSGNTTINTVTVTVEDTIKPVLEVKNITVQLDSSGNASVTAKDLITNTSDNCSVADTTISIVTGEKSAAISVPAPVSDTLFFSCSDTGENKVEIKLTDNSGNTTINTVTVTVEDNIKPVLEVKNITVQLDSSGNASVTAKDLITNTSDNCSVADTTISIVTGEKSAAISVPAPVSDTLFFSCSDTGENKVEIKLTDNSGNTTINTVTVTVEDNIKPVLEVKNITVQLDSSGNASITAKDLVTRTMDNCSVADTTISIVTGEKSAAISVPTPVSDTLFFSCSDTGENKVEIKLTDNSGNTTINTVTVTVEDTIKPVLEVKNITVQLDSSGNASITAKDLVTGTLDNCSVADTTISIVTGEKSAAISVPAPVSDTLFFSCSDTGENKVEIKLTDNSGNTTINTVTVTVEDTIKPVLEVKNITVQLDSSGNASVTASDLVTSTSDNCSVADTTISIVTGEKSAAISVPAPVSDTLFFSCSDTGENKVEIKLTDNSGNTTINTVTVTVEDNIKPVLEVKNITVQLDSSGNASVTASDLVTSTSDNCSVADTTISIVAGEKSAAISVPTPVSDTLFFSCSDTGENKVEIKLTDNSGNTTINTVTVTVEDTIKPVLDVKNITVQLDSSGNASITAKDLVTSTSDNCSVADTTISIVTGEKSAAISVPAPVSDTLFFSCSDTGENKVEIKLTDNSGNTTINTVTVTVEDTIKPVLEVKNITVQLDSSGNASITAKDLVTSTSDNCSVADTTISIVTGEKSAAISVPTPVSDTLFFSCSDTGENKVEIKLTDNSGNTTINMVTVTVEDTIKPVLDVKNITVQLDSSGNASITASDLVTSTSDNCSVADTTISIVTGEKSAAISVPTPVSDTLFFSCSDTGENKVEIKLTDKSGNTTINTVTVTVEDTIKPVLEVKNITVQLDSSGNVSITAGDLVTGTLDNCSFADTTISKSIFDCSNLGENKIVVTLYDASDNSVTDTTLVTVEDTIKPVLDVKNITVQLDSSGNASITTSDLVTSTSDNCSVADATISKSTFDCSNVGVNIVALTLYDFSGNTSFCTSVVTVKDNIAPVIVPVLNIDTVLVPGICEGKIDYPDIVAGDNCEVELELIAGLGEGGIFPTGTTTETWVATDAAGNTDTLSFDVVVTAENTLPTLDPIANVTVDEDTGSVMVGVSGISSGEDCSAQGLVISAKSSDETLTDTIIVGYTTGDATATLEILLAPGMSGTAKITVAIEDSEGGRIEKSFMLTVNAVNDAPYLITSIIDQAVHASYVLKVPVSPVLGEMFDDVDDDVLVIMAAIEGPDTLPGWATFENDTLIFRPTIADTGCVNIVITATDTSGAMARDTFEVCVDGYPVGIEDLGEGSFEVAMYPNPTSGKVNLEFKSGVYDVELSVMDITGKTVFRKSYTASGRIVFDMSDKVAGMYFVKMDIDGTPVVKKLIVKK